MKKIAVVFFLYVALFCAQAQEVISPSIVIDSTHRTSTKLIKHLAYSTCVDTLANLPLYVSHAIDKEIIAAGKVSRKRPAGYPKDSLYTRLKSNALSNSGYDHGHMAPARDFKWNAQAWYECFYMTNMAPQHGCCNQRGWCYLESLCRYWAEISEKGDVVYIVSGVVPDMYKDTLVISKKLSVYVPTCFYKVVLAYNAETKTAKGIGFVVNNGDVDNETALQSKTSIDEVEKITSFDFFSLLDDELEIEVESTIGFTDFACRSECGTKSCESVYNKRELPNLNR